MLLLNENVDHVFQNPAILSYSESVHSISHVIAHFSKLLCNIIFLFSRFVSLPEDYQPNVSYAFLVFSLYNVVSFSPPDSSSFSLTSNKMLIHADRSGRTV
jgi:hypothetical protein